MYAWCDCPCTIGRKGDLDVSGTMHDRCEDCREAEKDEMVMVYEGCEKHEWPSGMPTSCPDCAELAALTSKIEALERQIALWKEYHAFLNKSMEGPIALAWIHGWRCPDDEVKKGADFRAKLGFSE